MGFILSRKLNNSRDDCRMCCGNFQPVAAEGRFAPEWLMFHPATFSFKCPNQCRQRWKIKVPSSYPTAPTCPPFFEECRSTSPPTASYAGAEQNHRAILCGESHLFDQGCLNIGRKIMNDIESAYDGWSGEWIKTHVRFFDLKISEAKPLGGLVPNSNFPVA